MDFLEAHKRMISVPDSRLSVPRARNGKMQGRASGRLEEPEAHKKSPSRSSSVLVFASRMIRPHNVASARALTGWTVYLYTVMLTMGVGK